MSGPSCWTPASSYVASNVPNPLSLIPAILDTTFPLEFRSRCSPKSKCQHESQKSCGSLRDQEDNQIYQQGCFSQCLRYECQLFAKAYSSPDVFAFTATWGWKSDRWCRARVHTDTGYYTACTSSYSWHPTRIISPQHRPAKHSLLLNIHDGRTPGLIYFYFRYRWLLSTAPSFRSSLISQHWWGRLGHILV